MNIYFSKNKSYLYGLTGQFLYNRIDHDHKWYSDLVT